MAMKPHLHQTFDRMRDRLSTGIDWFPFPAFILFAVVLVIIGKALPGLNPKTGSRAQLLRYEASDPHRPSIPISISPLEDDLLVTTRNSVKFRIPAVNPTRQQLQPLADYLRAEASDRIVSLVILDRHFPSQTWAILSVDERLKFDHLRGIITALAEAGISSYSFETAVVAAAGTQRKTH
jgi:hypothetical protein